MDLSGPLFGILGALIGALIAALSALMVVALSFVANSRLKEKDFEIKTWDKLLERRMGAHEKLIAIATELCAVSPLGGEDEDGEIKRTPTVLASEGAMDDWLRRFAGARLSGSPWLTIEAKREANYVQDYMASLYMFLKQNPALTIQQVGAIVRTDFTDNSASLEKAATKFFYESIWKRGLPKRGEWHKYPQSETKARFARTKFMTCFPGDEA